MKNDETVYTGKDKPVIGISSCLLGNPVRYDGGHKLDRLLRDGFGPFIDWVPVCPESECGLSIPREAMRLVGVTGEPRLVTIRTGLDHTERMRNWASKRLDTLGKMNLCGFIFKSRSPSSAMRDAKRYSAAGVPSAKGPGIFAAAFMERFPLVPVEDEGRLNDDGIRANFIERVFVYRRWKSLLAGAFTVRRLMEFHADQKLLVMSHSPSRVSALGSVVAAARPSSLKADASRYYGMLAETLKLEATRKKHTNVLHHAMGYFKKRLTPEDKEELGEWITKYHDGFAPLAAPVTLLRHHIRTFGEPYLERQVYLYPEPAEWMLKNRV
jgi:uncharacterized protein YbgA (DUF1722 family)/uncharacterized protein YbbK (DUF523 family)